MTARYARQTIYPPIGVAGQTRLAAARVLVVGCGALGGVIANVLVRGGVGYVRLVDRDTVETSNLHRQMLFSEADAAAGAPKATAAAATLRRANSEVEIAALVEHFDASNAEALIAGVDLVLDGTDNFETRYIINDACVKLGKAWIYAAVVGATGVTMTVAPQQGGPCFRCAFPEPPPPGTTPTCDTAGVIGAVVEVIGGWAAAEALKLLVQSGDPNLGLLSFDLWRNAMERLPLARDPACPACARHRYDFLDGAASGSRSISLCGRNAVQVSVRPAPSLDLVALAARLGALSPVAVTDALLRFHAEGYAITLFADGRAIIKGTDDPDTARALYARYIGL